MSVPVFDTLKFANTLKAAGVPSEQAEAQAVAFAEVIKLNLDDLVDKDDLATTAKELKQEIKDAEQRVGAKLDAAASELKVQVAQVKGELVLVRWMLGVLIGGVVAILIRLFLLRGPVA